MISTEQRIKEIKAINPRLVVAVRVELDADGEQRAIALAQNPIIEVIHIVADINGNQIGVEQPKFIKDMTRHIHTSLVKSGVRDEITLSSPAAASRWRNIWRKKSFAVRMPSPSICRC